MSKKQNQPNFENILLIEGINSKGFGFTPKLVMKDRRLTIEAKAIYNYFCSYAGGGNTAFPSVSLICDDLCISKSRYYKHFKLLTTYGYVSTTQTKEGYSFAKNIYTLHTHPKALEAQEELTCTQNKDTAQTQEELACTQNEYTACTCFRDTQNKYTQNEDTNNNTYKSNNFNNNIINYTHAREKTVTVPAEYYYDWMNEE